MNQPQDESPPSLELKPRVVTLNVMVAGLSGLGKTTTCTALLQAWNELDSKQTKHKFPIPTKTRYINATRIFERADASTNTILKVKVIDTPGFGNQVNHKNAVRPICRYIQKCRKQQFLKDTFGASTSKENGLVHVCLYFLSPGRFLEMDAYFLKLVQKQVCVIPIIAKADTLTDEELALYRAQVVSEFAKQGIYPYNVDDKRRKQQVRQNGRGRRRGECLAVVSRDGMYPWGEVQSMDPIHSDLTLVRDLLLSQHTETLVELAQAKYQHYRARQVRLYKLSNMAKYVAILLLSAKAMGVPYIKDYNIALPTTKSLQSIWKFIKQCLAAASHEGRQGDGVPTRWFRGRRMSKTITAREGTIPNDEGEERKRDEEEEAKASSTAEQQQQGKSVVKPPGWFLWLGGSDE